MQHLLSLRLFDRPPRISLCLLLSSRGVFFFNPCNKAEFMHGGSGGGGSGGDGDGGDDGGDGGGVKRWVWRWWV